MGRLRSLTVSVAAVPAVVFGLSMSVSPAEAGVNPGVFALARRGMVVTIDMMSMQPQQPAPSAPGPPSAGGMPGGGMMGDDKMEMPMQQPAPPAGPPAANGGMQGAGSKMDDKMGMPSQNATGACGGMPGMQPPGSSVSPGATMGNGAMQMPMMQAMMRGQTSDPLDRLEGRIAFLKAELGITDAQTQAWDQFAQALRTDRQHLLEARQALSASMGQSDTLSRLTAYEHHLSMRLDALRSARENFARLYEMLSGPQKRTADDLALPFLEAF